ncbi:hypothetical protein [Candidatus Mycoplasma haematominutum]|uniref:Uncharacterized protein n=1 Tax=Candidatus Mycoplasma haematominutum 'Birmingham 1' TaxID=1116213 RepID=G8C3Q9_9MOLU|nr:hypothetical protein [Candidatus Mycoplasma haematominutum]CCE66957.1 hypothetical protein MHM_04390 [Candidatus Mycoplasma haematominutum 'Birmingham 1']
MNELKMCTSVAIKDSLAAVNYGDEGVASICWELAEGSSQSDITDQGEKFSSLFKSVWNKQDEEWNNKSYGEWKDDCSSPTPNWTVFSSGEDGNLEAEEEYLGLCSGNQVENTPFVKRKKESGQSTHTLSVCTSSCWNTSGVSSPSKLELQEANESNWKTVKFFKQKVS